MCRDKCSVEFDATQFVRLAVFGCVSCAKLTCEEVDHLKILNVRAQSAGHFLLSFLKSDDVLNHVVASEENGHWTETKLEM